MLFHFGKLVLLFFAATVCHWAFSSLFANWGISINMLLVFVTAVCAFCKMETGYPMAFLCGLFLDFFSTKLFGYNAFSFTLAALVVYSVAERLDFDSFFPQMFMTFVLTVFVSVVNNALVLFFTASTIWAGWWNILIGALVATLVAPIVFTFVRWLLGPREMGASRY